MKYLKYILMFTGLYFIAITCHEIYHWLTVKDPVEICYNLTGAVTYHHGYGTTSELVAYGITLVVAFLGGIVIFWKEREK